MNFTVEHSENIDNANICMQLKGGLFPLTTLQLLSNDLKILEEQLSIKIEQAPNFFNNTPIVIDLYHLSKKDLPIDVDHNVDFIALKQILLSKNLIPVGVKNANEQQQKRALEANLAILRQNSSFENYSRSPGTNKSNVSKHAESNYIAKHLENNNENISVKNIKNKLILSPVRSGQQIYAPDGDITVVGSVSHGAELLANGNIHVYGALRGRALAGINNDNKARIFCNSLEADLISIAGQFKISENINAKFWKKQVQICLSNGKLEITEFI